MKCYNQVRMRLDYSLCDMKCDDNQIFPVSVTIPPSQPQISKLSDTSVLVKWSQPKQGLSVTFFKVIIVNHLNVCTSLICADEAVISLSEVLLK